MGCGGMSRWTPRRDPHTSFAQVAPLSRSSLRLAQAFAGWHALEDLASRSAVREHIGGARLTAGSVNCSDS
jgi:hypothetical protein